MRWEKGIVRDPATDAFVAKLKGQPRADAERLLAIIRKELPNATEAIKWRAPFWFVDGQGVVFLMVFDKFVHLGLVDGATLPDPEAIVTGTGQYFRHVKLSGGATDAQLRKYVKLATRQAKAIAKAANA